MQLSFLDDGPVLLDDRFPLPCDRPFTTRQALATGVGAHVLTRLVRDGYLYRPLKGVYVPAQVELTREVRGQVIGLCAPAGSVITDWSATWYWTGLDHPSSQRGPGPLSVFRFRGHGRLRNQLVASGQRWLRPSDVVPLSSHVTVTSPIRTAWDLGRFSRRIVAIGGMDALARHGTFTVAELVADVERFRKQRGVVQLRELAPLVDPRSESTGESALRLRWIDVPSLPRPEPQVSIVDESGREIFRIDLGVQELRFGAEYDGQEHHSSEVDRAHDHWRRDALDTIHGWTIEAFRREDVFGQHETVTDRLPRAVATARARLRHS